ncbi:MAG: hypothetical protein AAF384_15605 [Pseudomonadota bacterium]
MGSSSKWMLIIAVVLLLPLLMYLRLPGDIESDRFENLLHAQASGLIGLHGIPAQLPDSSYDIRLLRNTELKTARGRFKFEGLDEATFRDKLTAIEQGDINGKAPFELATLHGAGFDVYGVMGFAIAVNWQTREGRFWAARTFSVRHPEK